MLFIHSQVIFAVCIHVEKSFPILASHHVYMLQNRQMVVFLKGRKLPISSPNRDGISVL